MSLNNVIPAELLSQDVDSSTKELDNPKVTIPEELVTDCFIRYEFEGYYNITAAFADHPAFAEVRKLLNARGYIEIPPYPCWNGDRVLKRFQFNGVQLEVGDTFYCAAAWKCKQ